MTTSGMILVSVCVVVAIWDLAVGVQIGERATVSYWIRQQAVIHPTLILALGVLLGHFFAAMSPPPVQSPVVKVEVRP